MPGGWPRIGWVNPLKGRKRPAYIIAKVIKARTEAIAINGNPLKGRSRSQETIDKIRETKRKKREEGYVIVRPPMSEQAKENISKSLKGRVFSEQTKEKISISLKGRTSPRKGQKHIHVIKLITQPKLKHKKTKVVKPKKIKEQKVVVKKVVAPKKKVVVYSKQIYRGRLALINGW
jgi:hypothetical protein